jgi:hypothetical protein
MSDLKQFLDWSGLKHYDSKIKDYIGDRTCSIGEDGYWYVDGEKTANLAVAQNGKDGVVLRCKYHIRIKFGRKILP